MITKLINVLKNHWQLLILIAIIFTFWRTAPLQPLRVLIVFLHEFSHAAATILTGGEVVSFTITPDEGGQVISRGGSWFLGLTAGYLGSLLIGVLFLLITIRSTWDRVVLALFGATLLATAALYIRDLYAITFTIIAGVAMLATARFLPDEVSDLILRTVGLSSMIYVPFDIFSDTIARSSLLSDARMLCEEYGGTTIVWGILCLLISLLVIAASLRKGLGANRNIKFKKVTSKPTLL
ncbi:MAG: M50 family metallopeptidase [Amylibacter sp.]